MKSFKQFNETVNKTSYMNRWNKGMEQAAKAIDYWENALKVATKTNDQKRIDQAKSAIKLNKDTVGSLEKERKALGFK